MHSQDCDRSWMFVFHFGKSVTVLRFLRFLLSANDWHRKHNLTLAAIPIQVKGVKISLNLKNLPSFRSCRCRFYNLLTRLSRQIVVDQTTTVFVELYMYNWGTQKLIYYRVVCLTNYYIILYYGILYGKGLRLCGVCLVCHLLQ